MRVLAHVERAVDGPAAAVLADGLRDGHDVSLIERAAERRAPVPAGAEADQVTRLTHIGRALVVLAFEPGRVHQQRLRRRLARQGGAGPGSLLPTGPRGRAQSA